MHSEVDVWQGSMLRRKSQPMRFNEDAAVVKAYFLHSNFDVFLYLVTYGDSEALHSFSVGKFLTNELCVCMAQAFSSSRFLSFICTFVRP